jgi:hypothetical protein
MIEMIGTMKPNLAKVKMIRVKARVVGGAEAIPYQLSI